MSVFLAELLYRFVAESSYLLLASTFTAVYLYYLLHCYLTLLTLDTLADGDGVLEARERNAHNR